MTRARSPLRLPTGSALDRAFRCPDSEMIRPHVITAPSRWSEFGSTFHAFLQRIGTGVSRDQALAEISEDDPARAACEALDLSQIPTGGWFELALAWNYRTGEGRKLGENIDRAYEEVGADRTVEYCLSIDFAGVRPSRVGVVVDFKTGWQLRPAAESWQLKLGALALADLHGLDEVLVAHLQLREGRAPRWDIVEIDGLALAGIRKDLRDLAGRLGGKPAGVLTEGEHCKYCPAQKACPAKVGHTQALARAAKGDSLELRAGAQLTAERAREAVLLLERYDAAAKVAWAELEAYARQNPIDLGDGRIMQEVPGGERDKVVDAPKALQLIARMCDEEAAEAAGSTTKKAIASAVAAYARRTGKPISGAQVIEALRAAGAIRKEAGEDAVRIVKQ